jgi:RES domain-containing protein
MPKVFVAIEVSVHRSLDLTSSDILTDLGLSQEEILEEDWREELRRKEEPLTQAIGGAAFLAGLRPS